MARELSKDERLVISRADLDKEIEKWRDLQIHPSQAIGIDVLLFNSRFHALMKMLEEAGILDADEHEIKTNEHFMEILKERREEITPEIQEQRIARIKNGRLH